MPEELHGPLVDVLSDLLHVLLYICLIVFDELERLLDHAVGRVIDIVDA